MLFVNWLHGAVLLKTFTHIVRHISSFKMSFERICKQASISATASTSTSVPVSLLAAGAVAPGIISVIIIIPTRGTLTSDSACSASSRRPGALSSHRGGRRYPPVGAQTTSATSLCEIQRRPLTTEPLKSPVLASPERCTWQ